MISHDARCHLKSCHVNCCTTVEKSHLKCLAIGEWPWRSLKVIRNSAIRQAVCQFLLAVCNNNISILHLPRYCMFAVYIHVSVTFRTTSVSIRQLKLQASYAFQFMFPRCGTSKALARSIQVISFLLVFHCICVCLVPFSIYYHLFAKIWRGHMTLIAPDFGEIYDACDNTHND